jgi:hypothetical protein
MDARACPLDPQEIDPLVADMNSGKPWSELSLDDLRGCTEHKQSTAEIATFLCRSPQEVNASTRCERTVPRRSSVARCETLARTQLVGRVDGEDGRWRRGSVRVQISRGIGTLRKGDDSLRSVSEANL